MPADNYGFQISGSVSSPSEAELRQLIHLCARYPRYRIFWSADRGRGVRYTAQGAAIGVRPHAIVTNDLAELQNELEQEIRHGLCIGPSAGWPEGYPKLVVESAGTPSTGIAYGPFPGRTLMYRKGGRLPLCRTALNAGINR